ncbi:MAG: YbhB/YbcL family Raf kinase inhibitor-like protein [Planctomycetes bacterium]|jgi:Raf kinase inhibitor-like YbhB/YbcL family protein|nr:YbhB/YbcL family Raf kinase inhibitor-like protein [Planctomycetota bacterium]
MQLTSPAFDDGQPIAKLHAYKGEGRNVPPNLTWSGAPQEVQSFALIVDDPDAPRDEPFVHWVAYNIAGGAGSLPTDTITQGVNDFGEKGYGGPMPPEGHGVHHYHFKLYALDADLALRPKLTKSQLLKKIDGHVIATSELVGTYER